MVLISFQFTISPHRLTVLRPPFAPSEGHAPPCNYGPNSDSGPLLATGFSHLRTTREITSNFTGCHPTWFRGVSTTIANAEQVSIRGDLPP